MVAYAPVQCNGPLDCQCGWPMKAPDWLHGQKDDHRASSCPALVRSPSEAHPADRVAAAIPVHSVAFACEAHVVHPVVDAAAAAAMIGMVGHALHALVLHTAGYASCVADAKRSRLADHPSDPAHAYSHSMAAHQPASMHYLGARLAAGPAGAEADCRQAAFGGRSNLDSWAAMAHDFPYSHMSAERDHPLQTRLSVLQMTHLLRTAWRVSGHQLSRSSRRCSMPCSVDSSMTGTPA